MQKVFQKYYAKILLFGEYSVIHGSDVLSIPFQKYSGHLVIHGSRDPENYQIKESNQILIDYFVFLDESDYGNYIELERMYNDISSCLFFDSDIPVGYGLGSSGALVASIFKSYGKEEYLKSDSSELIRILGGLESWFHGQSSGMDPLSSFLAVPLKIKHKSTTEKVIIPEYDPKELSLFLLDTGQASNTGPLVDLYKRKSANKIFLSKIMNKLNPVTNNCIKSFLEKDSNSFFDSLQVLSEFQYEYFPEMIPEKFMPVWKKGLETKDFSMKLCGSGGGGYLSLFSKKDVLPSYITDKIKTIKLI